jgi:hypothetical protein
MALIRYGEELKGENPELSKKAICEKASNINSMYRIKYLFSKFLIYFRKYFSQIDTLDVCNHM